MGDKPIHIEQRIERASTLPSAFYSDTRLHDAIRESVFAKSWQWIGDTEVIKVPGQVYPFTLLEGFLDEPMLFVRDQADEVRCLSNVCTHRGNLVCEHPGNEKYLRCRYHGRRFGLDGAFQHMPEFEGTEGFPSPSDDLSKIPFAVWKDHLFAGIAPSISFRDWIAPVEQRVGWLPLENFRCEPTRCTEYLVRANWALYCDNYLEGFHIPFVHASLNEAINYADYATELFDNAVLQVAIAKGSEGIFDLPSTSPDYGKRVSAYYFLLFPNLMLNFYPWGLSLNVVRPIEFNLTKVSFVSYVWDASKMDQGAGAGLDRVEREDEAVVESVQKGIRSRFYDRGRFSPSREQGVHHFHRYLADAIG